MRYSTLGKSNLNVSRICLGSMTWGEQNNAAEAFAQMDTAVELGINFFDVAEMYPVPPQAQTFGATECIMGDWLKQSGKRSAIILASKVTGASTRNRGVNHIRNGARLCREQIFEACEASLRRLQTDYLDLYQVHWPERATNFFGRLEYEHQPEEDGVAVLETLEAMTDLVKQGKVRHVGISNETPWGIHEYLKQAWRHDLAEIVSIQNSYNLLNRTWDLGGSEMCLREGVAFLAYSPLAFGKLTGKYLNGQMPSDARLALYDRFIRYEKVNCNEAIAAYVALAHEHGLTPAQLALAFVNQRSFMTSNIIGATTVEQLKENIESIHVELSKELIEGVQAIHQRYPNPGP